MKTAETSPSDIALDMLARAGLGMMALAATVGMLELPERPNSRVLATATPTYSFAGEQGAAKSENPLRREREEETGAHSYLSYGIAQRTPGRSGKF